MITKGDKNKARLKRHLRVRKKLTVQLHVRVYLYSVPPSICMLN